VLSWHIQALIFPIRNVNGVVVQGKMTISCCSVAFSGGVATEKSEIGKFSPMRA
jgi:hypothetical protein